ncbi:inhibitor of pro-sigmak processing bofa [hydrocarbon metagenome]|uniref:Inhibitor of pro-sigmak processing bofa n=1 Tax=hydrocarbon metagenome TaxID=938273 RepID=A0A0W8E255_9ZZZZ
MEMINIIIAALFVLVILYLIAQVFLKPIKLLWKLIINSAVGVMLLLIINFIGAYFSFILPVNLITILIAGFLGIPGLMLLICFQLLMT